MAKQTNPFVPGYLAEELSAVAAHMGPREAAAACSRAADALTTAMAKQTNPYGLGDMARGLSAVAAHMRPPEAAAACSRAADALTAAMAKETNQVGDVARGLSAVAGHMGPREAAAACSRATNVLTAKMAKSVSAELWTCLTADPRRSADSAAALVGSAAVFPWPGPPLAGPALLAPNLPPCRVSTQELVELLKLPTCVGPARRVVLDQLGGRYGRRFADHWDFVRFAHHQNLGLDLTSPRKQPEPTAVALPRSLL
jgi:hypothetical protein